MTAPPRDAETRPVPMLRTLLAAIDRFSGAVGAVVLVVANRNFSLRVLRDGCMKTIGITSMILTIVLGGLMYSGVFAGVGGLLALERIIETSGLGGWGTLAIVLAVTFLAGFVLDVISIILIVIPVALPMMSGFGFDLVWFCILFIIVLQTSLLAPPSITLRSMYRGVLPFVALHFVVLALVMLYPGIALWLPQRLIGLD